MTGSIPSSSAERRLVGVRERFGGTFDQECRIETPGTGKVSNGAGGWVAAPPAVQPAVRCELRFPTADPTSPAGEAFESTLQRAEIRLPVGTPVSIKSRIVVGGDAFEVQGHDAGRSFAPCVLCDCVRANDGK